MHVERSSKIFVQDLLVTVPCGTVGGLHKVKSTADVK